jgi:hypothetical protein
VTATGETRARLLTIPWVRELAGTLPPCEGVKWSKVSLKHLYSMGGRPPEGLPDRARCKRRAHYRYTASGRADSHATTGNYCHSHVGQQLYAEWDRYDEWRRTDNTERTDRP